MVVVFVVVFGIALVAGVWLYTSTMDRFRDSMKGLHTPPEDLRRADDPETPEVESRWMTINPLIINPRRRRGR